VHERRYWDDYMHAYEEAISATASKEAPWFVVPCRSIPDLQTTRP
jgi:polyphosphate kinase 2 (PPK2 family)